MEYNLFWKFKGDNIYMGEILDQHTTDAAVLACVDFRFWKGLPGAVQETFGVTNYDDVKIAGGAGNLLAFGQERKQTTLDDLELAVKGHQVGKLILLTHQTCGKYASIGQAFDDAAKELAFHTEQLHQAGDIARAAFPDVEVLLGFAHVAGNTIVIDQIN